MQLNGPFVPRRPSVVSFGNGCVTTLPELVRFGCETQVARGDGQDDFDLRFFLPMASQKGLKLPHIEEEETGIMVEAVGTLEDENLHSMFIDILPSFEAGDRRWGKLAGVC